MTTNYEIDQLDLKLIQALQQDAMRPFEELARELKVSGGTVHVRFRRLREEGIIRGTRAVVDHSKLGYDVVSLIGVSIPNSADHEQVIRKFKNLPEITEVHVTTGKYSFFLKVIVRTIRDLNDFINEKLSPIREIQSTETIISLDHPIQRELKIEAK